MGKTLAVGAGFVTAEAIKPEIDPNISAEESIAKDIHAIRERAVLPPYEQKKILNLAASGPSSIDVMDTLGNVCNSLIVSVITGTLNVFLGDDATSSGTAIPDFQFTNVGQPVQILLPPKKRRFSFQASGGACTAKAIALAI